MTYYKIFNAIFINLSPAKRKQFLLLIFLTLFSLLAEMISIGAIVPFIAVLSAPEILQENFLVKKIANIFDLQFSDDLLLPITIIFCITVTVAGVVRFLLLWFQASFSRAIGVDLSVQAYERTLFQPYSFYLSKNSSEILANTSKVNSLVSSFIHPIFSLISSLFVIIGIILALLFISPQVTLIAFLGFSLIYLSILVKSKNQIAKNSQVVAENQCKLNQAVQEGFGGIRDVLIDGSQPFYKMLYQKALSPIQAAYANNQIIAVGPKFGVEILGTVFIALLAYVLQAQQTLQSNSFGVVNTDPTFSILPLLGALALGAQRILPLLQQIYASIVVLRSSHASVIDAIDMINQSIPSDSNCYKSTKQLPLNNSIVLKNISFCYEPSKVKILEQANLIIKRGSRVGIIGPSGSGKSTLLDIMMGLLSPTSGQILIDNQALNSNNLRSWQKSIAHVPQSIFLSDASITQNIAFGVSSEDINLMRVKKAAERAQISNLVESWPGGYSTLVGERGIRLSGGQRQRIGIARALYKNAKVIFFDEATSALDNQTESEVMQSLEGLGEDITVIIAAHRLTTLRKCDSIIEIKNGRIITIESPENII